MFVPTLREDPADATAASHRLLQRAGFIRPAASGTFLMLPLGMRVIDKLVRMIDEEMATVGAHKLSMPVLHPSSLWKKTGRWESSGSELWRLKDRKGAEFCLAPTHEELFTQLIADSVHSAADLPLALYQVGPKYRDEARPRFGLLRGREFLMKDAYSFHETEADALQYYREMEAAYRRFFNRLQRPIIQVEADGGGIGGSLTHEFQMLADVGEDIVLSCSDCGYASNEERAVGMTRNRTEHSVRHDIFNETQRVGILVCSGDRKPNPMLLQTALGDAAASDVASLRTRLVAEDTTENIVQDASANGGSIFVDFDRAVSISKLRDRQVSIGHFTFAEEGDACGRCGDGTLSARFGIEVGQIFYLGNKYSSILGASTTKENGKREPMYMGCYGIGVSRILAALVDATVSKQNVQEASKKSLDRRAVWPAACCPYVLSIVTAGGKKSVELFRTVATDMSLEAATYDALRGEIVLDDRWRAGLGTKLTESELVGYPFTVIVGRNYEAKGLVEVRDDLAGTTLELTPSEAIRYVDGKYREAIGLFDDQ